MAYKWVCLLSWPASPPWLEHKRRRSYGPRPREKNRFGKQCYASIWRLPNNFRRREKKIAFEYKNHWRILHNFLCRPAGKKEKNAKSPDWWRCRELHSSPPTACQNRYRLSPEFVSAGIRSRQQFPAMLRIVLNLRGTKCAPVGSSLNLTQYSPLRRVGYKRGTLKRAPRPSRWSWLLCFLTLFYMAWSTMTC